MSSEPADALLTRIRATRAQVETFVAATAPRKRRLLNTTIVGGTVAAALTAAPAMGGQSFTAWLTMTLGLTSPSWRLLCGAASICSLSATVATQMLKSTRVEELLARAVACRARLEVLETGLVLGHLDLKQASADYLRCVEDAAVIAGG